MSEDLAANDHHPDLPERMSVPCARYLATQFELIGYIAFAADLSKGADKARRVALEALAEADPNEERRSRAQQELESLEDVMLKRLQTYGRVVHDMTLTRSVDNFLNYVSELLALIFKNRPDALRSNEEVRVDFVLNYATMDELIDALAERRVERLAYKGLPDLVEYLSDRLGFELFPDTRDLDAAILAVEMRNLIVHNRGVVNDTFLSRIPVPAAFTKGDRIDPGSEGISDAIGALMRVVTTADNEAAAKWGVPRDVAAEDLPKYAPSAT